MLSEVVSACWAFFFRCADFEGSEKLCEESGCVGLNVRCGCSDPEKGGLHRNVEGWWEGFLE